MGTCRLCELLTGLICFCSLNLRKHTCVCQARHSLTHYQGVTYSSGGTQVPLGTVLLAAERSSCP